LTPAPLGCLAPRHAVRGGAVTSGTRRTCLVRRGQPCVRMKTEAQLYAWLEERYETGFEVTSDQLAPRGSFVTVSDDWVPQICGFFLTFCVRFVWKNSCELFKLGPRTMSQFRIRSGGPCQSQVWGPSLGRFRGPGWGRVLGHRCAGHTRWPERCGRASDPGPLPDQNLEPGMAWFLGRGRAGSRAGPDVGLPLGPWCVRARWRFWAHRAKTWNMFLA
jgi:hypothetical protein